MRDRSEETRGEGDAEAAPDGVAEAKPEKSDEAFRTISEVSDQLGVPSHVLRFWETRFDEITPVKKAGGRRHYRPEDVALIAGIRHLLHEDGVTIKGVQKLLADHGVAHVVAIGEAAMADTGLAQVRQEAQSEEDEMLRHIAARAAAELDGQSEQEDEEREAKEAAAPAGDQVDTEEVAKEAEAPAEPEKAADAAREPAPERASEPAPERDPKDEAAVAFTPRQRAAEPAYDVEESAPSVVAPVPLDLHAPVMAWSPAYDPTVRDALSVRPEHFDAAEALFYDLHKIRNRMNRALDPQDNR